jgi:hypothetical protein
MPGRTLSASLAVVALAGCRGCYESHPYVPYAIANDASLSGASPGPSASGRDADSKAPSNDAGDSFAEEPAIVAPPGAAHWSVGGVTLDAPDGQVIFAAIVGDFDGDGASDAFALLGAPDGADPGDLAFYRAGASPGGGLAVASTFAPPTLARGSACIGLHRLARVGSRTAIAELGARCPDQPSTAPARWLAVVDGEGGGKVRLAATLADPSGAPDLEVRATVADRDRDGRDDLALEVSLEGGGAPLEPGPRVAAILAFLDRPAGLSRDSGATDASFAALAASAMARAARSKEAGAVPGYAAQVRALWRAVCADGGAPRLVAVAGTGAITCGGTRALSELGFAEVRAYASLGDPLRAALALNRTEGPPGSRGASRMADAKKWIAPLAPVAAARMLRSIAAVPLAPRPREVAWGALAFEVSGKLLVRTRAGVVRVDPDQGDESSAGVPEWPAAVTSPDGALRWIEAYDPCDGLPLRATFELASGSDERDVALPVPAPPWNRCAGSRGAPVRAIPIAWGPHGLEAIVESEPILVPTDLSHAAPLAAFLGQPVTLGSPRSPDGKAVVVATALGFLVRGAARTRMLRGAELDGTYVEQRDCVVSDDGTHVACAREGRAWVGTWDAQ